MSDEIITTQNWFARHQKALWLTLVALAVGVAGLLTYLLFFRSDKPQTAYEGDVALTIEMPRETPAGSEISITVGIENRSNSRLTGMVLELFYPQDFIALRAERSHNLPDLGKGGRTEIVAFGVLSGNIAEVKTVSAKLKYIPENFRSTFVAEAEASIEIQAANLAVSLLAPTRVITGQAVLYRLEIENVSAQTYDNLTAVFQYPLGFEPSAPNGEASIGDLAAGEKKTMEAAGTLAAAAGAEALAQVEIRQGDLVLARSFAFTQVDPSPLAVSHAAACRQEACGPLEIPGEVEYKVRYQNQSQVALKNVVITVFFDGVFSGAEITAEKGVLRERQVSFLPSRNPELRAFTPGQKGEFIMRVRVPEAFLSSPAGAQKNPVLATRVEYKADEAPRPLSGNSLSYPFKTKLALAAKAVSAGDGTYLVELTLTNTVNDLTGVSLTAFVPGGAVSDFSETAEWSEDSGLVRWRLGELFAFTGSFHEPRKLTFKVTTNGQDILRDIQAVGRDDFADVEIESNKITTLSASGF